METFNGKIARHDGPPPPLPSAIVAYTDVSFSACLNPDQSNNTNTNYVALDDNELSVFDARRYFNEGNDHHHHQPGSANDDQYDDPSRFSSVTSSSIDGYSSARNYRARSFHATPTACSEASWNSQTGLLSNPPNSIVSLHNLHVTSKSDPDRRRPKSGGGGAKWLFRRRCPCIGKKSLQVIDDNTIADPKSPVHFSKVQSPRSDHRFSPDEKIHFQSKNSDNNAIVSSQTIQTRSHVIQLSQATTHHNECATTTAFSFPILKPSSSKVILKNSFPNVKSLTHEDEEPPRESLDVFRPRDHSKSRELHVGTRKVLDDDLASDGSSDLFEIESFSTQTTSYTGYDRRMSLDEASNFQHPPRRLVPLGVGGRGLYEERNNLDEPVTPSMAPSEIYEPSEVSVDWSVTTAEGFDRASVATYDERSEVEKNGGKKKGGGHGLLGCRWEKAVSVGPSPFKMGPQVTATSMMMSRGHVCGRANARAYENGNGNGEKQSRVTAVNFNKKPPLTAMGMEVGGRSQSHHQHQHHPAARVASLAFDA